MACILFFSGGLHYGYRWNEMDHFGWILITLQFSLVYAKTHTEDTMKKAWES